MMLASFEQLLHREPKKRKIYLYSMSDVSVIEMPDNQ